MRFDMKRGLVSIVAAGIAAFVSTKISFNYAPLRRMEAKYYASNFYLHPAPVAPIVLISVTDETIREYGDIWNDRGLVAGVVKSLLDQGARVVGLDTIFHSSRDRAQDGQLARLARTQKNVVFASELLPGNWDREADLMPQLQAAKPTTGYVTVFPDPENPFGLDAIPLFPAADHIVAFSIQIARKYIESDTAERSKLKDRSDWYRSNDPSFAHKFLPYLPINYSFRDGSFVTIPFEKFYKSPFCCTLAIQDKVVIVGTTAESLNDYHDTPLTVLSGKKTKGLVTVASSAATMISGRLVRVIGIVKLIAALMVISIIGATVRNRKGILAGLAITTGVPCLTVAVLFYRYFYYVPISVFLVLASIHIALHALKYGISHASMASRSENFD